MPLNYFLLVYAYPSALLHIANDKAAEYSKRTGNVINLESVKKYAEGLAGNTYALGGKAVMKVACRQELPPEFVKWAEGVYHYEPNTGILKVLKKEPGSRGVRAAAEEATISKYGYMYLEETNADS